MTLEAPSITEAAVAFGLDYVVVDAEHGHLDWGVVLEHIRATVRSKTCAFVRLQENGNVDIHNSAALVKRALDIGADGVLVPCVETAEQCRVLVSQARYPFHEPSGGVRGIRGIGGERATLWGQNFVDHVQEAAEEPPFVVPLLETHPAFLNREEIAQVVSPRHPARLPSPTPPTHTPQAAAAAAAACPSSLFAPATHPLHSPAAVRMA